MKIERSHVKLSKKCIPVLNEQEKMGIRKILLIQRDYIGDVILTTPLIRETKKYFPLTELYVLGRSPSEEILSDNPHITKIIIFNAFPGDINLLRIFRYYWDYLKLVLKLRRMKFDLVINITRESAFKFALLTYLTGAKYRVSIKTKNKILQIFKPLGFGFLHTIEIPINKDKYVTDYFLDTIRVLGHKAENNSLNLFVNISDEIYIKNFLKEKNISANDAICIIHPFSNYEKKQWSEEGYKAIIPIIANESKVKIFLVGGQKDCTSINDLIKEVKIEGIYPFAGMSWGKLKALMKISDIFVGSDSGPMHIAASLGLRTVVIMTGNSLHYAPKGDKHKIIIPNLTCYPCYDFIDYTKPQKFHSCGIDCLKTITPEEVLLSVKEQISIIKNEKTNK